MKPHRVTFEVPSQAEAKRQAKWLRENFGYEVKIRDLTPCTAEIQCGPGHQSTFRCEKTGPHEIHYATYYDDSGWFWADTDYVHQRYDSGREGFYAFSGIGNESIREEDGLDDYGKPPPEKLPCPKCDDAVIRNPDNTFICTACGESNTAPANWEKDEEAANA